MSTKEEKIILSVETARSAQSVSDLQKILKAAKDELIAAKEGSKEYKTALETAAAASNKLATATKSIKDNVPTTPIKELKKEILEAKNAMMQAEEGSAEYTDALKRAADASFKLREMNEEIKNSSGDVGEALGNSTKVMGGLLQGATAVTAGMQLFGIENESVVEGIATLQQVSAIAQGVQGMEGLGKSIKALSLNLKSLIPMTQGATVVQRIYNAVVASNPIMFMVVAIAALIAGITALVYWMKEDNKEQEQRNILAAEFLGTIEATNKTNEHSLRISKAQGATEEELYEQRKKILVEEGKELRKELNRASLYTDRSKEDKEYYESLVKMFQDTKAALIKNEQDIEIYRIEQQRKKEEEAKANNQKEIDAQRAKNEKLKEDNQKAAEKQRKDELKTIDAINEAIRQKQLSELDKLAEKYQAEKALFEKHQKDTVQLMIDYEKQKSDIEKHIAEQKEQERQAEHERQMESIRQRNEATLANIDEYWLQVSIRDTEARTNGEITEREFQSRAQAANIAHLESVLESEKLNAEQEIQVRKQLADAKKAIADIEIQHRRQIVGQIGALAEIAAEIAGRETVVGKGLAIAAATISTFQAAQQGYLSAFMPPSPFSPALGALNVAAALAVGFKNIKQIVNTKVPGKSGGGGMPSGGGGTPTVPSAPRVPSAPNIPQSLQPTRNVQTQTEIDLQRQPLRAYVVETELRGVQDRAHRTEAETTI